MKRFVIAAIAVSTFATAQAQTKLWGETAVDSVKCWENLNIAGSYYQNKTYLQAYDAWLQLYTTCPGASKNTYIIAPKIIEAKIAEEKDQAKRDQMINILIQQYDDRIKYFYEEDRVGTIKSDKASDYLKYHKDDTENSYKLFEEAFEAAGKDMYPAQLNNYFISTVRMFNEKKITIDQLLINYNFITDALDYNVIKYSKEVAEAEALMEEQKCDAKCEKSLDRNTRILDGYDKVQGNIEKMLAPLLGCENLDLVYSKEKFEENQTNVQWLKTALRMLEKEREDADGNKSDCTSNPMYFQIAEALYKIEPSAQAARSMAKLAYKKNDMTTAVKYFEEAISLEEDPRVKANDYLKASAIQQKRGNLSQAKTYALSAAKLRKNWGDPYIVLAGIYADAAGTWGSNAVEKNAVYWAAIDKLNYAISIDPNSSTRANKLIAAYKKVVPDKATAFALGVTEGTRIEIGSWINETVVVKFY
jgi:tetratricopeptide (TPR) repeat protein